MQWLLLVASAVLARVCGRQDRQPQARRSKENELQAGDGTCDLVKLPRGACALCVGHSGL